MAMSVPSPDAKIDQLVTIHDGCQGHKQEHKLTHNNLSKLVEGQKVKHNAHHQECKLHKYARDIYIITFTNSDDHSKTLSAFLALKSMLHAKCQSAFTLTGDVNQYSLRFVCGKHEKYHPLLTSSLTVQPDTTHMAHSLHLKHLPSQQKEYTHMHWLQCDVTGVDWQGKMLTGNKLQHVSGNGFNLHGATLKDCQLTECQLIQLNASEVTAEGFIMTGGSLANADLSSSDFQKAQLTNVDLRGADFTRSDFRGAKFTGCQFDERTKWDGTRLEGVTTDNAELQNG